MTIFTHSQHTWEDDAVSIASWHGGDGPAVLLLHGYPQTHRTWDAISSRLAQRFQVVMIDLRGYGDSTGPAPDAAHLNYCKRTMAQDAARVMQDLGIDRYAVVGHDRGGRVGHRLALDAADHVTCFSSLTVIPTLEMWQRAGFQFGMHAYHWYLLAQPAPLPETLLTADPDLFLRVALQRMTHGRDFLPADHVEEYLRCFRQPAVRQAMIEDYRAAATIDLEHDQADLDRGHTLQCPVQVLWETGRYTTGETPIDIWSRWASRVTGGTIDAGHLMPEEAPEAVLAQLVPFLDQHLA